ncbi:MAG: VWA domain-containing protein [Candidatus Acidiferrales bacterium]
MKKRRLNWILYLAACCVALAACVPVARGQQAASTSNPPVTPATASASAPAQAPAGGAIKAETRLVRVDAIVTDKKGHYLNDLTENDFRVYEDNKQQEIVNFSFGAQAASAGHPEKHYMILFFDNSTMDLADQPRARDAAAKFIDAGAGPDRVIAIVNFSGTLQITQNFTGDAVRLKQAVQGIRSSAVSANSSDSVATPGLGAPGTFGVPGSLGSPEADFGAYTLLLALRTMANNLAAIPGRKSLILLTSGFPLTPEGESELMATIDACNKANVAIYPLDVRGLVAPNSRNLGAPAPEFGNRSDSDAPFASGYGRATYREGVPGLVLASFRFGPENSAGASQQRGGGGGGGMGGGRPPGGGGGGMGGGRPPGGGGGGRPPGGGGSAGGPSGGKGGSPGGPRGGPSGPVGPPRGSPGMPFGTPNYNQARDIVPSIPDSVTTNQEVLYSLAEGTGGFPIYNTNDLLAGLEKISKELDEYYFLGYAPKDDTEGACHTLRVKVDRGGTEVRSRSGYCNVKPNDVLAGQPVEKQLETEALGASAGNIGGSLETSYFYESANQARVNLSMDIASSAFHFDKVKGKYHADINILGIAYRPDGTVAARFSDDVALDFEKGEWKEFTKSPMPYQNQFIIAPGKYRLDVVVSGGGQDFGKYESPLRIDSFDGKTFSLSGVALSDTLERIAESGSTLDADMLAGRLPLVVHEFQIVPAGSYHFKKSDKVAMYAQIYAPNINDAKPPAVVMAYNVIDQKTGKSVFASGAINASEFVVKGNPVIPVALRVPVENFPPGSYRLELQAGEMGGTLSPVRSAEFQEE